MYTFGDGGEPSFQLFEGNIGQPTLISSKTTTVNRWYHLAVVLDESTLSIYLDGLLVASLDDYPSPNGVNRSDCFLGRSNWYPNNQDASVYLDEIYIYNRALSLYEIIYNMNTLI